MKALRTLTEAIITLVIAGATVVAPAIRSIAIIIEASNKIVQYQEIQASAERRGYRTRR